MYPNIQCHLDNAMEEAGEMEIISTCVMPRDGRGLRQKCWIRCKLVTLVCDRDHGVSVSTGHNIFSLHIVPVFFSIKENLKSKSNLHY